MQVEVYGNRHGVGCWECATGDDRVAIEIGGSFEVVLCFDCARELVRKIHEALAVNVEEAQQ